MPTRPGAVVHHEPHRVRAIREIAVRRWPPVPLTDEAPPRYVEFQSWRYERDAADSARENAGERGHRIKS